MRVLHVVSTLAAVAGGPAVAAANWAAATRQFGIEASFVATDYCGRPPAEAAAPCEIYPAWGPLAYSPPFRRDIARLVGGADACHIHGLWLYPILAAAAAARRQGVPYVITPHGMLDPYHCRSLKRRLRNHAFLRTVHRPSLDAAQAIHFLTEREQRNALYRRPNAEYILPNLMAPEPAAFQRTNVARLLSISVFSPRKRLESLIEAVPLIAATHPGPVFLKIAGGGPAGYTDRLRRLAHQFDPGGRQIEFVGLVSGAAKADLLRWASVFCLVSDQEAQSVALLEALAHGIPALISAGSSFPFGEEAGFGRVISHADPALIASGVASLLRDPGAYASHCAKARAIIEAHFSPAVVGLAWAQRYRALVAQRQPVEQIA